MIVIAQRRRHHVLRAFETGPLVFLSGEEQIVRAGLRMDRNAAVARLGHRGQRLARGQVHDVERRPRQLREPDGAMGGFAFEYRRARGRVVLRRAQALSDRLLDQHLDDRAVLGMDAGHRAVVAGHAHRLEQRAVVHHQHARIGHEQLEARHAFAGR